MFFIVSLIIPAAIVIPSAMKNDCTITHKNPNIVFLNINATTKNIINNISIIIDCGLTGGARFVLIKKTSGTGSWYVWDSARGIVSGNDPYLLLNSTAAEVTNTDYIDTYSAGFEISSTAPSEINENGGSFIFLAIA